MTIIFLVATLLSLLGIALCLDIHKATSKKQGVRTCPFNTSCGAVLLSKHSHFFSLPNEFLGALFYSTFFISNIFFLAAWTKIPSAIFLSWYSLLAAAGVAAVLFSLYLVFIQLFTIRSWCTRCSLSAFLTLTLTLLTFFGIWGTKLPYEAFLLSYSHIFNAVIILGFALGLGGATFHTLFFFRFLNDFNISQEESNTLDILASSTWIGLSFTIIGTLGFLSPNLQVIPLSELLGVHHLIIIVLLVNALILNTFLAPRLTDIYLRARMDSKHLAWIRRFFFMFEALSLASWYCLFLVSTLSIPFSFNTLLGIYVVIAVSAMVASQLIEIVVSLAYQHRQRMSNR